ncbi:hypothetical protein GLYMA_13G185700v4 [Glycine max]|uniref:Uncharacterized protein n=2 Tax=Glycine subgen. Soja TaxID=1462606 RepID=A0A0R0GYS0_SOYBN|nr:hypothetical protein JHK86_036867 [Glycine max]KAH1102193.1 hypothetical protein GYH30_036647 [Glycine max]KRH20553.1 hypothetical protein GLYMA_13G185700v4 [Glycine max]RZB81710.1 hypothetical protein D0Y65_031113 [Glycine soja]
MVHVQWVEAYEKGQRKSNMKIPSCSMNSVKVSSFAFFFFSVLYCFSSFKFLGLIVRTV